MSDKPQKGLLPLQFLFTTLTAVIMVSAFSIGLTGCYKSDADKCIDRQSHLWDNSKNPAHQNKAYWDAVAACKEKYK